MREQTRECWAGCEPCGIDFSLSVMVPCPVAVYVAALKAARCPSCGKKGRNLFAYEPGRQPPRRRHAKVAL